MIISDAVLLGGGLGTRYNLERLEQEQVEDEDPLPKQFAQLGRYPVFIHGLKSLLNLGVFRQFVLVFPEEYIARAQSEVRKHIDPIHHGVIQFIRGGETRYESSRLGILALENQDPLPARVIIHDACRPYLSPQFLNRLCEAVDDRSYGAWVPAVPVTDTLKRAQKRQVLETVSREKLFRVQTPQVFEYSVVRTLFDKVPEGSEVEFTDDASLCEYYGIPVGMIEGDERNIKLTYPFHLDMLRSLLANSSDQLKESPCELASDTIYTD